MTKNTCELYLDALNKGNLDLVLSLFTSDAVVNSPLYGQMSAQSFYAELFSDTNNSKTTLIDIQTSDNDNPSIALHFNYVWTLKSGKIVEFECVDVFGLSAEQNKFSKLTIIYVMIIYKASNYSKIEFFSGELKNTLYHHLQILLIRKNT